MMFASDLDRTLIFSTRVLKEFPCQDELTSVEQKSGKDVSFMTKKSHLLLKEIASKILFVPVTTRSIEQFKRIDMFQTAIKAPYIVTTNGATIFYKDHILKDWNEKITKDIKEEAVPKEELIKLLATHFSGEIRNVDHAFIYYILKERLTLGEFDGLKDLLRNMGWRILTHGKKLYFIPKPVSKGNAVKYIQAREGKTTLIGAGDSLLDEDFLEHCQHRFVPSHGELVSKIMAENYNVTINEGAKSGEELLSHILSRIETL
ncbi:HAD family hydrolase [Bacillus sp. 31A1R]|uniref:HAD family hydrolase n=1 Tax=Robertmurraya mangrovi TaxID=3098077 RepID=A0ABU5J152_9BACI|nr:HAD family hydrolase [Bacillus sp. 31A1R]MDZ5473143.1 HAD family hydrolase [Bacillus sp. 31A1R]